jgi:hypothetical protein
MASQISSRGTLEASNASVFVPESERSSFIMQSASFMQQPAISFLGSSANRIIDKQNAKSEILNHEYSGHSDRCPRSFADFSSGGNLCKRAVVQRSLLI